VTGLHSSVRSRELGRRLLSAQQKAGFSGLQLGSLLHWAPSMVSRTMSGHRPASDIEVASILGLCAVIGLERDEILRLCYPYRDAGLRLAESEHLPVYLAHARHAVRLIEFQPYIVPWMLQTPDYTRALIADSTMVPSEQEAQVTARRTAVRLMELPRLEVLVHEWALRTPVQNAAVMSDQLHHLIRMSIRSSVSVRVVPIGQGVHAGRHGPFTVLEFREWRPVLYREDPVAVLLDEDPLVALYRSIARDLDSAALDESESRERIGRIAVELYGEDNDQNAAAFAHPVSDDQVTWTCDEAAPSSARRPTR
jgi:hypothetical protein